MNTLIKARAESGFHRCGVFFPHAGRVFAKDDFTAEQWKRLEAEPALHLSRTDTAPTDGAVPDEDARADLKEALTRVIVKFPAEAFQKDGKPKIDFLRKALPDHKADITADLRDAVWEVLEESGFEMSAVEEKM